MNTFDSMKSQLFGQISQKFSRKLLLKGKLPEMKNINHLVTRTEHHDKLPIGLKYRLWPTRWFHLFLDKSQNWKSFVSTFEI